MFKNTVSRLTIAALVLGPLLLGQSAKAAYTWDYNATGNTSGGTAVGDGPGTWDTVSNTWFTGVSDFHWNNPSNTAVFGGNPGSTPYTVTLGGGSISANGITFQSQAYTISSGTLNLLSPATVTVNSSAGGTMSATISGSAGLTKAGNYSLTITNTSNSYTGSTQVRAGTLVLGANNALPTSAALVLGISSNASFGTVDLAGFSQIVGSLNTAPSATAANQTIGNSAPSTTATLTINGSSTYGGSIQDGGGQTALTVTGGLVILSGNNTYSGVTAISGGELEAAMTAALPGYSTSGKVSVAAGATLAVNAGGAGQWAAADIDMLRVSGLFAANANLGIDTSGGSLAYPSNIANSGGGALGLVKLGSNALVLSGSNTYSGPTLINAGVLSLANSAALSIGTAAVTFAGGTLQFTASNTVDYSGRIVNSTGPISIDANGQGVTFGTGLASSNTGGLTLNSTAPGSILTLAASNGCSGTTSINAGVLSLANSAALPGTTAVTFAGGTLQFTASNGVDYSGRIVNSTGPISIDANGQSVTFGSGMASSNTGGLTLNSSTTGGILTLAASSGYAGTTLVSGGKLILADPNALSASTFDSSGTGSLSFGGLTSAAFGGLQGSGNLTLSNTSPAAVALSVGGNNASTTFAGQLSGGGSLTKAGGGLLLLSGSNNYTGGTAISGGVLNAATTAALPGYLTSGSVSVAAGATLAVGAGGAGQWAATDIDTLRVNGLFNANANLGIDTSGGDFTYSNITDSSAGTLGLVKLGSNTLVLSGSNTYTGSTTISGGTLQLGSSTALYAGAAAGNLIANGTLDLYGNSATVGAISGSGAVTDTFGGATLNFGTAANSTFSGTLQMQNLTKNGAGTFLLTGTNNATSTAINLGTFQIGNGTANGGAGSGTYTLGNNARLYFNQGASPVTSGPWSGLSISGGGMLELNDSAGSGAVLYSPLALASTSGTLTVDHRGLVQSAPLGLGGMTTVIVNSGAQFLASDGMTLGNSYTYTQGFSIAGLGSSASFPSGIPFAGALRATGSNNTTFSGPIALTANSGLYVDTVPSTVLKVSGVISGASTSSLAINVSGYPQESIILAGANTYTGSTTVTSGNLTLANSAALQFSTLSGSPVFDTADAGTNSFIFGGLTGTSRIALVNTSSTSLIALSVGNNNATTTYSGILSSGTLQGSLTKIGSGSLTLSGSSTYIGGTTISGGTLKIGAGSTTGALSPSATSTNTITDNGTLAFNRSNSASQGIAFSPLGITGSGGLVQLGPGNLFLNVANSYSGATTVSGGSLTVNGSLLSSGSVTVAGAATLAGSGSLGATTVNPGGILLSSNSGAGSLSLAALNFGGSASLNISSLAIANTSSPMFSIGSSGLSTSGANSITITVGSLAGVTSGTIYQLFGYSGSIGGSGTSAFQFAPLPNRTLGHLSFPSGLVDMSFGGSDFLHWGGAVSSAWDTTSANWTLNSNGGTTTFVNGTVSTGGDTVVFDNAAGPGHSSVTLATTVFPLSVTVSSSNNYSFSGAGSIGGVTPVTINGPGSVTLANTNSYTGGTFINGGTLALGVNNGLPAASALTLGSSTSNGTFDMSGYSQSIASLAVGAGAAPANQVITTSSGSSTTLTFSNTSNLASVFAGTIRDTAPSGGTLGLTLSGGTLDLTAGNAAYHGPTTINAASTLLVSALPNSSIVGIFGSNATLGFVGAGTTISTPILNEGNIVFSGGSGTLAGSISSPGGITGTDSLRVASGGLSLTGSAVLIGPVTVSGGGTLNVPSGGALSDPGQYTAINVGDVHGNGTFVVSGGSVTNSGGVFVNSNCALIMSGGVLDSSLNFNGDGGIGIGGYCSVSGGLFTASAGSNGSPSITISGASAATMNVSGGTVSAAGNINVGTSGQSGTFNQSGGFVTCVMPFNLGFPDPFSGAGPGTANFSGGTLDLSQPGDDGDLYNGYGQSSTVNISGSACVIVPIFNMGKASVSSSYSNPAIVNTLNLNGGTLNTDAIVNDGFGLDTNTVNFNGGHLKATSDSAFFLSGMTHANVLAGGALIDDGGFAITIDQNLQSGASPDGGLIKSGSGTLTLSGSNTYMGGTTVTDGTLIVANSEAIADGTSLTVGDPSAFSLAPVVPSSAAAGGSGLNSAIAPVPEPGTLVLLAAALGSAAAYRRFRRRR